MWMSKEATLALEQAEKTDDYWIVRAQLDFAKELNKSKNKTNINGKTLAQKLGTSAAYISKVLRGDTNLTIESMVRFARATGANVEIKLTPMAAVAESKLEEAAVSTHSCKVFNIPTPMMKALTTQKTEVSKAHVRPKFIEQFYSPDPFGSAEETMAFLERTKAYGENTMWHETMQYNKTLIAKTSNGRNK